MPMRLRDLEQWLIVAGEAGVEQHHPFRLGGGDGADQSSGRSRSRHTSSTPQRRRTARRREGIGGAVQNMRPKEPQARSQNTNSANAIPIAANGRHLSQRVTRLSGAYALVLS